MKGQSGSLKVSSLPSLGFLFCCFLMCFVCFVFDKKKTMAMCHHLFMWWCCNEKGDGSLLPSPFSMVVFKWKRQWQLVVVAFFFVLEKKKIMSMRRRLLLWCCWNKKGNGNKLSSPSFLCLRRRRRKGRRGNVLSSFSMVVF